jgi:hypothetical protein
MKRLPILFGALLVALAISTGTFGGAVGAGPSNNQVYLPTVYTAATPTPLALGCQSTGQSYGSLPIVGSPLNMPAAQDPDINLNLRGWALAPNSPSLSLVNYPGSGVDPNAPQLAALFVPPRLPGISAAYDRLQLELVDQLSGNA